MKTKPHYVPVRWLTRGPLFSHEVLTALRAVERAEAEIRSGQPLTSALMLFGLASVETAAGHVVFKPGELPIWISTPTG